MTALVVLSLLAGGRDPFGGTPPPPSATPVEEPCTEELCRFAVTDLKLVAIVSGDADPVAMFEDPRGKGMIARKSSRIGRRGGRITAISRTCVTIVEAKEKSDVCLADDVNDLRSCSR